MRHVCATVLASILLCTAARATGAEIVFLPLETGGNSVAQDINARGDIVGMFDLSSVFLIRRGEEPKAYSFPGRVQSVGNNDRGDIVGTYQRGDQQLVSFLIDRAGIVHALTIPGLTNVVVEDINSRGDIVGWSFDEFSSTTPIRGFLVADGEVRPFDNPFGFPVTAGTGIANDGTIVGYFGGTFDDPKQAFVLHKGEFTTVSLGAFESFLFDVESNGDMVGSRDGAGFFIRHNGATFEDLGHDFIPRGVNASGTIVGESQGKAAILLR
jgi:hypothetical protein